MHDTKANTLYIPLQRLFFVIALAALTAGPVSAQGGAQADGAQTGAGQGLAGGLNPDQAFEGGIERSGAVGESNAPAVGASATSTAAGAGGGGAGGGGFGGGFGGGGLGAAFGNLFNNNAASGNSSTPPIRTRLRNAVALPPGMAPSPTTRQFNAQSRFQNASSLQPNGFGYAMPYNAVNVQIRDRTAILQGTVANEGDRRMSEMLMRLEPGVSRVQNRISVNP